MPAELAGQRPLLERAAAGDREAFALVYDTQVEGVYRYLLAWTGNPTETAELTAQVFHAAIGWLPAGNGTEGEAAAWLTAMTRDALAQRQGSSGAAEAAGDVVAAVARLKEPEREVVVLRLLLGHSLDHTAHLSGYSRRAVLELQLTACLAVHELTGGTPTGSAPPDTRPAPSAEEFERLLGRWEIDLPGSDPVLADALAVAGSLRRSIPESVSPPPAEFVSASAPSWSRARAGVDRPSSRLRRSRLPSSRVCTFSEAEFWAQLSDPELPVAPAPPWASPRRVWTRATRTRATRGSRDRSRLGRRRSNQRDDGRDGRRGVAGQAANGWRRGGHGGDLVVLAVQAFGGQGGRPQGCGGRPCPVSTTAAAAAGAGSSVGIPLTTVRESTTTSSTVGDDVGVVAPTVPRTSAVTAPPTTRPATTAPPTTARPRPTTTTVPSTTAPTTTAPPTTTTAAPAPPT